VDVFDFKTGSLYAVLAIASSVYLLWGFSFRLRALLKALLAIQLIGDLIFFNLLIEFDVYRFIRSLTAEDRIYPLLILMAGVITMDAGAALLGKFYRARRSAPNPVPSERGNPSGANNHNALPLKLDETITRRFGIACIALAVIAKVLEMILSGVLSGSSLLLGILNWQPEMSSGYTFLETINVIFLPIGAALVIMQTQKKRHWIALLATLGYGLLSPWKGGVLGLAIGYGFTVYQFGAREFRRMIFSRGAMVTAAGVLLLLPIKAQFRYGQLTSTGGVELDADALVGSFVGAAQGRLMGGVFQSYVYVMNSLERGYPRMGGKYNEQALYLWVPRLLWPDKPDIAGEQIYYYLELTKAKDEPFGTSFATTVFGTFNLDFGFWGSLVCALLLGFFFESGERVLAGLRKARSDITRVCATALSVIWLNACFSFSEGGVPPAITLLLLGASVLSAVWIAFLVLSPKGTYSAISGATSNRLPGVVGSGKLRPS
jgi:hypothetical protein